MAELADALDSGSSESNFMKVQVLLPASHAVSSPMQRVYFCGCSLVVKRQLPKLELRVRFPPSAGRILHPFKCIVLPGTVPYAGMAELADALDSGSSESNFMKVQVLLPA